ncbi:MutS-related protein [Candidatus Caldatribacterium sp. SIUC1]|uniref:MutS-related protein n=1 Tax=Candidatus Caldatribacterium sp. SIUC1 TaxID=3418365 RepID=UPI003F68FD7A
MGVISVLFPEGSKGELLRKVPPSEPDFFVDLGLDQIVNTLTASREEEYHLRVFFFLPLQDIEAIRYRQEVMRDLEDENLAESIRTFSQGMHAVRTQLALSKKLYYKHNKEGWLLEAVATYCETVEKLAHSLSSSAIRSRGLCAFREYLLGYIRSSRFVTLKEATEKLRRDLAGVEYCLIIDGGRIKVRRYEQEADYSKEIAKTFAKFRQDAAKDYRIQYPQRVEMNHVEAKIAELVARLFPEVFSSLEAYCAENANFLDETVATFDREIQFYLAYLEYIAPLRRKGLQFCYPEVSDTCKDICAHETFDLALAYRLMSEGKMAVTNDFFLQGKERVFVVSGPNQGGKTTFARTFGQLHYLASLGCPVPGKAARLFLVDRIFTHFEREEDIKNLHGKLEDDLVRMHIILTQATSKSIIIINEIFNSTTLHDALLLSREIMERILQLDALCVWVTFVVELASLSDRIVSMVSTVYPDNPGVRTYKILRKPADGLAFALLIAEKYRLTRDQIKERIKP